MSNTNTGGPAFPNEGFNGWGKPEEGMTLRDYFAAKAMQTFIERAPTGTAFGVSHADVNAVYSAASFAMADAMLKARES